MGADRAVDPTYLRRNLHKVAAQPDELSAPGCQYRPVFGSGDGESRIARGLSRFGLVQLTPASSCAPVTYAREEQIYFVLSGNGQVLHGGEKHAIRKDDFLYLPPGVAHGLSASAGAALDVIVMGYKIPARMDPAIPAKLQIANLSEVKKQVVGNHPPSTLYQLMVGDTKSTRDRLSTGHVITSLFIMEMTPGGTNFPHHHDREEEVYLLLDGTGDMVAGGGMDGVEGRHASKPGDAFFIRLNGTVGFYNTGKTTAHILAIRSLYPFGK
ncbi:MAG: cupin domain-containing protein [Acidobacteriia bacterium]|nr:cupin domain-containing protein [Terriglobia bacterium]